jgi:hypothetical protein
MANRIRTLNFLPEIFQTPTNAQFLSATLDQLVDQPNVARMQGFIGSKFGYGINAKDYYVTEPTKVRTDYQLEPGVVFTKANETTAQDFISYPGIVDALKLEGGVTNNNNRLFNSQFYSWDSFTDLDKIINFNQYYWLPEGAPSVNVSNSVVYNATDYIVTNLANEYLISSPANIQGDINPTLTLLRGGTYSFTVSQPSQFWIQGAPGVTGFSPTQPNVQTRDVLGVSNNGATAGVVTFTVPQKDAFAEYNFPSGGNVGVVSSLPFAQVNGARLADLPNGIDGVTSLAGLTVLFYNTGVVDEMGFTSKFYDTTLYDENGGVTYVEPGTSADFNNYEGGYYSPVNSNFYTISYVGDPSDPILYLTPTSPIPTNQSITATFGTEWIGRQFFKNVNGDIQIIPYNSAILDTLYYQDGSNPDKVGAMRIIDSNYTNKLNVTTDILGHKQYTATNGVVFTNGLKVTFSGDIFPTSYKSGEYYVQGVGTAIELIATTDLVSPGLFSEGTYIPYDIVPYDTTNYDSTLYIPVTQDYITIARDAINKNAWSRSNRWFHIDVINASATYNNNPSIVTQYATPENKAKRPIIEFYPNLRLFNSGVYGKAPVDFIDFRTDDAFETVEGATNYYPDVAGWTTNTASLVGITAQQTTTVVVSSSDISGQFTVGQYVADSLGILPEDAFISDIEVVSGVTTITITWTSAALTFSTTDMSLVSADTTLSNYGLFPGARIVFASDKNLFTRNKIYVAEFSILSPGATPVITLTEAADGEVLVDDQTAVYRGYNYQGKDFYFDGDAWIQGQQKTTVNQPPRFDVFDTNGISFGDIVSYLGTSFTGTTLFQYGIGSGTNDSVLGFPIRYSNIDNVGDISFDVSFNNDTFTYVEGIKPITLAVNTGYVYNYTTRTDYVRQLGWQTAEAPSEQYQLFSFDYVAGTDPSFICDIPANLTTEWPVVQVYINNVIQSRTSYTYASTGINTLVALSSAPTIDTVVQILILSTEVSPTAYYTIPVNLNNNPLNENLTTVSVGDIRGQYQSIFYNNPNTTGTVFGSNNYRDLGNLVPWGNRIIQNSASLVLPGTFLRKQDHNLFNSLQYNSNEYIKFKTLLVDTVNNTDYNIYMTPATMLDDALDQMSATKIESAPFFWSDMIPSKAPYITNTYSFANSLDVSIYPLSHVYNFETANYNGVLVYLTRNGTTIQLIKGVDYTVSVDAPSLTVTYGLLPNDQITINEYNQTYGSYVPNTPTKLGLYPATVPNVFLDTGYQKPTYFIVGHDGSFNKLYGSYDPETGKLQDFRDQVLFEYETRVYNNLKLSNAIPVQAYEVLPGFFRNTDYSYDEVLQIYSESFLNWVGQNRIDYKTQYFTNGNQFTYNYRDSGNKLNGAPIEQGYWRGVYQYFYDTSIPDIAPWEMLGYRNMPTWWTDRYGPAPYTSDNLVLWTDLQNGYDYNDGNSFTTTTYARPGLLNIIPVDSAGNLVSPFVSIVGNYDNNLFKADWQVGDVGPAEFSYRRSSSWPFDLMRILALTKPAEFFNLAVDLDNYKYNVEFNQYLVNDRSHLNISNIEVYGNGTAKTSYLNWIVDYEKQVGIDATTQISNLFQQLDVRLVYRLAGFSDKAMLKFYVEKSSANSNNSSLLIPDESYQVLLYDNQPFEQLVYSGLIVQVSQYGFKVFGNSQTNAYFTTYAPKNNGNTSTITIEKSTVKLANDYTNIEVKVPYGIELHSVQEVSQFIASYGAYLVDKGLVLDQSENGLTLNWEQMVAEFMYWSQMGWEVGSIVTLNPAATFLSINKDSNVVQPLTIQKQNFVLNQNLYPIQMSNLSVVRDGTLFTVQPMNQGDTLAYGQFNISNFEHGIVFDNTTLFNDTIYNLVTGLRQNRISVRGSKTADWNGTIDAQGFILNQDNVIDWDPTFKYTTGSIVKYKNKYWTALTIIQPSVKFDETQWKQTNYDEIQKGLLPNPSARSYESTLYYDINRANLETDADLLSFSLIGYRPRDYLALADLTDITQVNVYKNLIRNKGTLNAASAFKGANLPQGGIDYDIYENWAIKAGEFGGTLNDNFIQFRLNESELTGNPTTVGLTNGLVSNDVEQEVPLYSLFNYGMPITDVNVLPTVPTEDPSLLYPTAGYVNFNDVKLASYYYSGLTAAVNGNGTPVPIDQLYVRDYLWLADYLADWQVYTPLSLGSIVEAKNNLNGTVTITFSAPHNLTKYQLFGIVNFDPQVNGYYLVTATVNPYKVIINANLNPSITTITGQGVGFMMQNQRTDKPSDIGTLPLLNNEFTKNKVWVDTNTDGGWAVYRKSLNYQYSDAVTKQGSITFGDAVAHTNNVGYLVGDAGLGELYRYTYNALLKEYLLTGTITNGASFGSTIAYSGDTFVVSEPTSGTPKVYVYDLVQNNDVDELQLTQTISAPSGCANWGSSVAISGDKNWMYISDLTHNPGRVYVYRKSQLTGLYVQVTYLTDSSLTSYMAGFGTSISTDYYGDTIVVGAPNYRFNTDHLNWGQSYIYNRLYQNIEAQYTNNFGAPQALSVNIQLNSWTVSTNGTATGSSGITVDSSSGMAVDMPVTFSGSILSSGAISANVVYYIKSIPDGTHIKISRTRGGPEIALNASSGSMTVTAQSTPIFVAVNGSVLTDSQYFMIGSTLYVIAVLKAGDIVNVSSGEFVLSQTLNNDQDPSTGVEYGYSTATNTYASEILIGAPFELNNSVEGAVHRYTNGGEKYGMLVATQTASVLSARTILLNGYAVVIPSGYVNDAATAINSANLTNISASVVNNLLVIQLVNNDLATPNNKLTFVATDAAAYGDLGIVPYTETQLITNPHAGPVSQFGNAIKFNESNSIVISAPTATRYSATTFDFTDDESDNDTVFDNNTTQWIDTFANAGAVYMFDYLSNFNETLTNVGQFVYAQSINSEKLVYGAQPMYGTSLDFNQGVVVVGTPGFMSGVIDGDVTVYVNPTGDQDWSVYRQSSSIVDIERIQNIQLFSAETNNTLDNLDYMDPLQGKLLGAIRENIDVVSNIDPAFYTTGSNTGGLTWGADKVGQLWFNTSTVRFVNYHQDDLNYNAKYWGSIFPGSDVAVYSWISSNVVPSAYTGPGTPFDVGSYTTQYVINAEGTLTPVYFFWARNTNIVFTKQGNTLADSTLEQYISSPINTGISYLAPLLPNVFALYNIQEFLNATDTVLNVGFSTGNNNDVGHNLYNLIRANYADDFLPGLPSVKTGKEPHSLYARLLDSLSGTNLTGAIVPDPYLPKAVQYGVLARPNQSFFINRFGALQNYIQYINSVLLQYPFVETTNSTFLFKLGDINPSTGLPFFDTSAYVNTVNWWAPGYNDNTKSSVQVSIYADLATLTVPSGTIATVAMNGTGSAETYILDASGTWTRIGLANGTIQISDAIWNYPSASIGFGDNFFDTTPFDTYPSEETRYIVRAINEEIPTDLLIVRNKALILLFEYIQSETGESQNYLPWLNKTSFIDVSHTIRELLPYRVFQSDNQDFLSGYINEVKPYHVVIKEFLFKYTGTDVFEGDITDFDLPAQYNTASQQFISPELVYSNPSTDSQYLPSDPIWQTAPYSQWFANHGLSITGQPDFLMTTLASYVSLNSSTLVVANAYGLPVTGVIQIDDEQIAYSSLNRDNNTLAGLTRGYNGTATTTHIPGANIFMDLPPVVVLNTGRGYIEPPKVTAYIDTTVYPEPTVAAILEPIMDLDKVIGVNVINAGQGYAVLPQIIIEPSVIVPFNSTQVSVITDTIELYSPLLQTGDLVRYAVTEGSEAIGGLVDGQQYYVNVLEIVPVVTVALFNNYADAINNNSRIALQSTGAGMQSLSVVATASCITSASPVRETQIAMRFDRTSYNSQVVDWLPGSYYGSFYAGDYYNGDSVASSSIQLQSTEPPIDSILASANGAAFEILAVDNVQETTWSGRTRDLVSTTSTGNVIAIVPSSGGAPASGTITATTGFYIGMPVKFEGAVAGTGLNFDQVYYVKTIVSTGFTVSDTISNGVPGTVVTLNNQTISSAGATCLIGEVTNRALLTIDYSGIRKITNTTATTNTVTVPLNIAGKGGTSGFYTGLPIFFVGENPIGGIVSNNTYYVTTVIDDQTFTMSTTATPTMLNVTATVGATDRVIVESTLELHVNDPVIFTGTTFGDIVAGTQYYVATIVNGTAITLSQTVNGGTFNLTDGSGSCTLTIQVNVTQLTTDSGSMTMNINLPVSPGQVNGQQFTLYKTSGSYPTISGTNGDLLTRTITSALATVNRVCLDNYTGGITNIYAGMQFNVSDNIGGLTTGTNYTVTGEGTTSIVVTNTSSSGNKLTCTNTNVLYVDMPIVFTGTSLGGISLNTYYYVQDITSSTQFTIATSPGGSAITVTQDNGTMNGIGDQYITVSNSLSNETKTVTLTQYINPANDPVFTISYMLGGYFAEITDAGEGFAINNTIFVPGSDIGGVDGVNDLTMTVASVTSSGAITNVICTGTPAGAVNQYYFKVVDADQVEVCSDPLLRVPVSGINFPYVGVTTTPSLIQGDYALLPEPFYFNSSIVKYNNRVYECIVSNNDSTFVIGKWKLLQSDSRRLNALDRIIGYYQPTINMPGRDLTQLVAGITYPNSTYKGNAFDPNQEFALDTILQDQPFYPNDITMSGIVWNGLTYVVSSDATNYSAALMSATSADWAINKLSNIPLNTTDLIYAGGKYVMTTNNTATPVLTSTDGVVWSASTHYTNTVPGTVMLSSVAYNNGVYVAVGDVAVTSTDLITWEQTYNFTNGLTNMLSGVTYMYTAGFTGFIAVGTGQQVVNSNTVAVTVVRTSVDGYDWREVTFPGVATGLNSIASNNQIAVAVGNNNVIYTTFNTNQWFVQTTVGTDNLNYVTYINNLFVAVGDNGVVKSSPDGVTWTDYSTGTTSNLSSVTYSVDRSEYVVVGDNNTILLSPDLTTWTNNPVFNVAPTVYDVQGDPFVSGYGPEEMVPGVVTDTLMMTITTRPGTNWEAEEYAHVGYNVVSMQLSPTSGTQTRYSFASQVETPTQVGVFVIDQYTQVSTTMYVGLDYTVDWVNKVIVLNAPLSFTTPGNSDSLRIDIYETGNGDQLVKSNTETDPIRPNETTGFDEIFLNCNYSASIFLGSGVIRPNTQPIETRAFETEATTNAISVDDTSDFVLNSPITFSGNVFGGIVEDQIYYVKTISNASQKITVSTSYNVTTGIAGPTYQLSDATGSMEVIIQVGSGQVWTAPVVLNNGDKLVLGTTGFITRTRADRNTITTNTTGALIVNTPIVFDATMFGGVIVPGQTYYVNSIYDANEFTISETSGGSTLQLTNATGGATFVTNDYAFGIAPNGISAKIIFANTYDPVLHYITYTVFGETYPVQYGYTLPETQYFIANGTQSVFALTNYVGDVNAENAIVEVDGRRLTITAYTINTTTNQLVLNSAPTAGSRVAVTSYNNTDRQYLNTQYNITGVAGATAGTYVIGSTTHLTGTYDQDTPTVQTYDENSPSVVLYDEVLDYLTLSSGSTSTLTINSNIVFQAPTIGGLIAGQSYYVTSILNSTDFTVSAQVGGTPVTVTTDSGSMTAVVNGLTVAPIVDIDNSLTAPLAITNVSATASGTNYITCTDTTDMVVGQTAQFKSASLTSFGGIDLTGTVYFIKTIVDSTTFTIADQYGVTITLSTDSGNIVVYVGGLEAVRVTTGINHNLTTNQVVRIDGTRGSVQLNNNTYYVRVINNTQFDLYTSAYNPVLNAVNFPVTTISAYTGGGYEWLTGLFTIYTTIATATTSGVNTITVNDTTGLIPQTPIIFTTTNTDVGTDVLGGIIAGQTYYILAVIDGTTLTISDTRDSLDAVTLTTDTGSVKVSQWEQMNVDRLWVTVNGYRIPSSNLYLNSDNDLSILTEIQTGDEVVITSMMPSATPNEQVYLTNVSTTNQASVYRAGTGTRTWLTHPLSNTDETIYVHDVTHLTDNVIQEVVAPAPVNGSIMIGLNADKNLISQVIVYNNTTDLLVPSTDYSIVLVDTAPQIQITTGVSTGDSITVTVLVGNLIYLNGEQIRFTSVDVLTNSITGLQRGTNGTGVTALSPEFTEVYGLLSGNLMDDASYAETWNSYNYDPVDGDPLQISTTTGANFLNVNRN